VDIAEATCHDYLNYTALAVRPEVRIQTQPQAINIASPARSFELRNITAGVRDVLSQLANGPALLRDIRDRLDAAEYGQLGFIARRLGGLLAICVLDGQHKLVQIEQTGTASNYALQPLEDASSVRLSEFTFSSRRNDLLVLESPLARHRVALADQRTWSLPGQLSVRRSVAEVELGDVARPIVRGVLGHLAAVGLIDVDAPGQERFSPDQESALRQWEFPDLLLHSRSRLGSYDGPIGGVYPFLNTIDPQPAVKPLPPGPQVTLYRPCWSDIQARDPSLTTALEGRESVRRHGLQPITADQLGEFLYRAARLRAKCGPSPDVPYEITSRPWPCGGGAYELELYLTIQRCTDLAAGIYYYDPVAHQLILINENATDRQSMLQVASAASRGVADPQVLITVTSRFQRLSWKYRAIAYSVTLRNVGVLYQTMYLVATAMSLAPCGLGSGNSELAGRVLGLENLRESAVGDFILGSNPLQPEDDRFPEPWKRVNDPDWAHYARQQLSAGDLRLGSDTEARRSRGSPKPS